MDRTDFPHYRRASRQLLGEIQDQNRGPYWTSSDGRKMLPEDFTSSHLLNTLSLLKRRFKEAKELLPEDIRHLVNEPEDLYPIYTDLKAEFDRRGITTQRVSIRTLIKHGIAIAHDLSIQNRTEQPGQGYGAGSEKTKTFRNWASRVLTEATSDGAPLPVLFVASLLLTEAVQGLPPYFFSAFSSFLYQWERQPHPTLEQFRSWKEQFERSL